MPTGSVRIDIEGIDQMRDKLGRFSNKTLPEQRKLILDLAAEATKQIAQAGAPVDMGFGRDNIYAEVTELSAAVITPDAYMVVQEFGRAANKPMPPPSALEGWAGRHGFGTDKKSLYVLARSIGRKGFEGKFFMTKAAEFAKIYVQKLVARASVEVNKEWDSGY